MIDEHMKGATQQIKWRSSVDYRKTGSKLIFSKLVCHLVVEIGSGLKFVPPLSQRSVHQLHAAGLSLGAEKFRAQDFTVSAVRCGHFDVPCCRPSRPSEAGLGRKWGTVSK
jgi:hypothetical protein